MSMRTIKKAFFLVLLAVFLCTGSALATLLDFVIEGGAGLSHMLGLRYLEVILKLKMCIKQMMMVPIQEDPHTI